jgi:hypothetical protein
VSSGSLSEIRARHQLRCCWTTLVATRDWHVPPGPRGTSPKQQRFVSLLTEVQIFSNGLFRSRGLMVELDGLVAALKVEWMLMYSC